MQGPEIAQAVAAARSSAASLGLAVDDAVVLQASNRLTLRLLPCDVVARVAPAAERDVARFEVGIARGLAAAGSPVAALDPRVEPRAHERDGFVVTFWRHHGTAAGGEVPAADYADALARLHAGLRGLDVPAPHVADRIGQARRLVADRERSPALAAADRELLAGVLRELGREVAERGGEQLLHGEPHPGNVLATEAGPLFVDLETCCRGPVEFDLAHGPEEAAEHYPGADRDLLRTCRVLVLAVATAWRWDRDDRLPDGHRLGAEWLGRIRAALDRDGRGVRG